MKALAGQGGIAAPTELELAPLVPKLQGGGQWHPLQLPQPAPDDTHIFQCLDFIHFINEARGPSLGGRGLLPPCWEEGVTGGQNDSREPPSSWREPLGPRVAPIHCQEQRGGSLPFQAPSGRARGGAAPGGQQGLREEPRSRPRKREGGSGLPESQGAVGSRAERPVMGTPHPRQCWVSGLRMRVPGWGGGGHEGVGPWPPVCPSCVPGLFPPICVSLSSSVHPLFPSGLVDGSALSTLTTRISKSGWSWPLGAGTWSGTVGSQGEAEVIAVGPGERPQWIRGRSMGQG